MQKIYLIHTSVALLSDAKRLADGLMQLRCCACVQITGAGLSIYRWQGEIEQAEEYYLNIKTNKACKDRVIDYLQQHHIYDVPEITWSIQETTQQYATWLAQQLRKEI